MLKVSSHAFERLSLRLSLDSVKNNKEIKNMIEESYEVTLEVASKLVNIIHNKKKNKYYIAFDPIKNDPIIIIVRDNEIVTILTKDLDWLMPKVGIPKKVYKNKKCYSIYNNYNGDKLIC